MTIKEYIEKHEIQSTYSSHSFSFGGRDDVFSCWISEEGVMIEQYHEGEFRLEHIKTMEQFSQLCELLTGEPFEYDVSTGICFMLFDEKKK